jgi:glycosyltransferase involved in cell wall biosynthesis
MRNRSPHRAMEPLVNGPILSTLYTSVKDKVYARPPTITLLVTHYKTPNYLRKCLESLFSQECSIPVKVILVDDASEMKEVDEILTEWEAKEPIRLRILRNTTRQNKGRNLFLCLDSETFHPESVIGIVDGDDWLAHPKALQRVVDEYVRTGCWVTYGSYTCSDGVTGPCTVPLTAAHLASEAKGRGFREAPWIFSHLFTAKAFLWTRVDRQVLNFQGVVEDGGAPDQIFNIPIAEMASSSHISQIPDVLYIYNNTSPLNEFVVRPQMQLEYDQKNRNRPAVPAIQRPLLDFLVTLPCRGRFPLLQATIQRFEEETDPTITSSLCLVEHSEEPSYKEYALEKGIGWLFVPLTSTSVSPLSQFNRGLCFDLGFLYGVPASYYVCHDNDLLVPEQFWSKLKTNLNRKPYQVLQTYSDRFVWQTNPQVSQRLIDDPSWFKNGFTVETDCSQNGVGAKGGSLTISREAYLAVGGHDPHLFYGYAAEDAFFWAKVQLLYEIGYGDAPRIPLTHLWHPNAANLNPQKHQMDLLFYMFQAVPESHRRRYLELKAIEFQTLSTRVR